MDEIRCSVCIFLLSSFYCTVLLSLSSSTAQPCVQPLTLSGTQSSDFSAWESSSRGADSSVCGLAHETLFSYSTPCLSIPAFAQTKRQVRHSKKPRRRRCKEIEETPSASVAYGGSGGHFRRRFAS